jgi:two-component sensor histidine kinase
VDSDKTTSIAIVLNELIENSLQHAFIHKDEGYIEIILKKGIMYSDISVTDNGQGFTTDLVNSKSLGLDIVKSIVKDKLDGDINIESTKNGTRAVFCFKNE